MLVDDELYQLFSKFAAGVRIAMLSDSCHSGTVARELLYAEMYQGLARGTGSLKARSKAAAQGRPRFRGLTREAAIKIYNGKRELYDSIRYLIGGKREISVGAPLILISGCQDSQLSEDGDENGLFTENLLEVWNNGTFNGNYRQFAAKIIERMPPYQRPNFFTTGSAEDFAAERVFSVANQEANNQSVRGPNISVRRASTLRRTDPPPVFNIDTAGAPFYAVEFASDMALFAGGNRNTANFYGSWSEFSFFSADQSLYSMPSSLWAKLNVNTQLFFRVGTSTSQDSWVNYCASTLDDAESAPFIRISD
jgi:hypothetical protein